MKACFFKVVVGLLAVNLIVNVYALKPAHGHGSESNHGSSSDTQKHVEDDEEGLVEISKESQHEAEIDVLPLKKMHLTKYINVPGEIIPNIDRSSKVAPRIPAQIIKRLANVGEMVQKGQPVAVLSSVEMAKAQSEALLNFQEWKRVKTLGPQAIGAKRYQEAKINYQHSFAKLVAYGMSKTQAQSLIEAKNGVLATGEFTLLSMQNGTIYKADITEGEMVEPGHVLYEILDESTLWVDARLTTGEYTHIKKGSKAIVEVSDHIAYGKVVQIQHKLDEITRTQIVRIEIKNKDDKFHPGQFADCRIAVGELNNVLALPESSVLRSEDGDWGIYVEVKTNHFKFTEVKYVDTVDNHVVIEGVEPGVRVVIKGAFAVHSEQLKSGFNVHNH